MASFKYVQIDGERVEASVAVAYHKLRVAFEEAFPGLTLKVTSGVRTRAEQERLYNGWIKKLPGFNLAARPGSSNHEETGPIGPRALDLRDTGRDAGVASRGTVRDRWMEENASRFGFRNAGYNFRPVEAWHKEFAGLLNQFTADEALSSSSPISPSTPNLNQNGNLDMPRFIQEAGKPTIHLVGGGYKRKIASMGELASLAGSLAAMGFPGVYNETTKKAIVHTFPPYTFKVLLRAAR